MARTCAMVSCSTCRKFGIGYQNTSTDMNDKSRRLHNVTGTWSSSGVVQIVISIMYCCADIVCTVNIPLYVYMNQSVMVVQYNVWVFWTWGPVCQKQVSNEGTSNYNPRCMSDVITCPCPWYLFLAHKSSNVYAAVTSIILTLPQRLSGRIPSSARRSWIPTMMMTRTLALLLCPSCRLACGDNVRRVATSTPLVSVFTRWISIA